MDSKFPNPSSSNNFKAHLVPNTVNTAYSAIPWYMGGGNDAELNHQRAHSLLQKATKIAQSSKKSKNVRGSVVGSLKRWHPGCCDNCGEETHQTKDCIELPRKNPAKYTNSVRKTAQSTVIKDSLESYQTKHDRWSNASIQEYTKAVLFGKDFQQSYDAQAPTGGGITMRDCEDMPAYLQEGVLSYDPRTHAVRHDVFKKLEESDSVRKEVLEDTYNRLEAIKKYQMIGHESVLPSSLDTKYSGKIDKNKGLSTTSENDPPLSNTPEEQVGSDALDGDDDEKKKNTEETQ